MEIGLSSWSLRERFKETNYDAFAFLDEAADMGFANVEIMTGKANCPPEHIGPEDPAHLRRVMAHAAERGITISSLATYNDFAYVTDETWRQANIAYIERWIDLAADMGVPNLRFLSGYMIESEDREGLEQLVIEATRRVAAQAEQRGVNLALENHNTLFFYAEDMARYFTVVDSPALTCCPDPSNGYRRAASD